MKGLKPVLSLGVGLLLCALMMGCAGSVPPNSPSALTIAQFTLAGGVIGVPYRQLLIVSGGTPPYTWTIISGSLPPGINLDTDGVVSGTPTATGTFNFVAQVVDSQVPVKAQNTYTGIIIVNPVLTLAPATLPNGLVGVAYSAMITASNGLPPYSYAIAFGQLPDGLSIDPGTGAITGTPTNAGVFNFTVQASDSVSEVATEAFTITVVGRLQGSYALTFNGFDNGQPFYTAASFVADGNGSITSGVLDQTGPSGVTTAASLTGTYTIPVGSNFGSMTLTSSLGTYAYNIVVSNTSDSRVILSDANHPNVYGSGLVKKQTLGPLPGGGASYSFGFFGNDSGGSRYAGAGMFAVDGTLAVTGGAQDTNDNGTASGEVPITTGSLGAPDLGTGRGTASLTTASGTVNYAYYIVSSTELIAVQTDSGSSLTLMSILEQPSAGITGSGFSNLSLKNQAVLQLNGASAASGSPVPDIQIGVATFDGAGNITRSDGLPGFFTDENNGGSLRQNSYNGTYNVDPTCGAITTPCGRVTVNLQDAPSQPVWYLVNSNQAFVVGTDAVVTQGNFQPQTGAPYSLVSLLGSYLGGTVTPVSSSVTNELDVASTPPPGGVFMVTFAASGPDGQQTNQTFSGPYNCNTPDQLPCSAIGAAFGRFEVTTTTSSGSPAVTILYIASGSAGATGAKTGLVGLNYRTPSGPPDPNPRITLYGR